MKFLACLSAFALVATSSAAAAATPCVTTAEAESIALVAMPEIIRQTGQACAAMLPATALIRQTSGAFLAQYDSAANRAWPQAQAALAKVAGPDMAPLLQSEFTRPLLVSLLAPALVGQIQTRDCGAIDHMITLLQPLPPRNIAGLVVSALELIREKQDAGVLDTRLPTLDLPLCPAQRR
ncbi:hypothetical protein DFR49_0367 [Hephaestia caeni]|uniref:YpeB-like protein with protease inhibitory function n=1 Tax=Hephaestia caeni TaxID=645617 RepID=A0A397PD45_9SPHN|nr:hypothetical protein [Hephaestia caeni]RIA45839.1 hypothetical protein DFR49_0367 [Hephaestia caeni]